VYAYYEDDAQHDDRLTVAPQIQNARMLRTTFLFERYQLDQIQAPNTDNEPARQKACDFANESASVMDSLEQQLKDHVDSKISHVYKTTVMQGKGTASNWCWKGENGYARCSTSELLANNARDSAWNAIYSPLHSKALTDKFDAIRDRFKQFGKCEVSLPVNGSRYNCIKAQDKVLLKNNTNSLKWQANGNLVVYQGSNATWSSNTQGHPAAKLCLQGDGNAVIYTWNGKPLWSTGTNTNDAAQLLSIGQNGKINVRGGDGNLIWGQQ
jgi:hypothetical protein